MLQLNKKGQAMNSTEISELRRHAVLSRWRNGGRPKGEILSMQCPAAEANDLRAWARRERIAPSEALRRAIRHYLSTVERRTNEGALH